MRCLTRLLSRFIRLTYQVSIKKSEIRLWLRTCAKAVRKTLLRALERGGKKAFELLSQLLPPQWRQSPEDNSDTPADIASLQQCDSQDEAEEALVRNEGELQCPAKNNSPDPSSYEAKGEQEDGESNVLPVSEQDPDAGENGENRDDESDIASDDSDLIEMQNTLGPFIRLLGKLKVEAALKLARLVRQQKMDGDPSLHGIQLTHDPEILAPLRGSFNLIIPMEFEDGVRWLFKVPARGFQEHFKSSDAQALESEALTMRLLRSSTTIPVPEIYAYSNTPNNEVGLPYILMQYMPGKPLSQVWYRCGNFFKRNQIRRQALWDIAGMMTQLQHFTFHTSGAPAFTPDSLDSLTPTLLPYLQPDREYVSDAPPQMAKMNQETPEQTHEVPIFECFEPHSNPAQWYARAFPSEREVLENDDSYELERHRLLRFFMESIPLKRLASGIFSLKGRRAFVLRHPDLDLQNVLVDPDTGVVTGVIDWDGVAAVPWTCGCFAYPIWLTRDWDPQWWEDFSGQTFWDEKSGDSFKIDSKVAMAYWRRVYVMFIRQQSGSVWAEELTKMSLVTRMLAISSRGDCNPILVLDKLFEEVLERDGGRNLKPLPDFEFLNKKNKEESLQTEESNYNASSGAEQSEEARNSSEPKDLDDLNSNVSLGLQMPLTSTPQTSTPSRNGSMMTSGHCLSHDPSPTLSEQMPSTHNSQVSEERYQDEMSGCSGSVSPNQSFQSEMAVAMKQIFEEVDCSTTRSKSAAERLHTPILSADTIAASNGSSHNVRQLPTPEDTPKQSSAPKQPGHPLLAEQIPQPKGKFTLHLRWPFRKPKLYNLFDVQEMFYLGTKDEICLAGVKDAFLKLLGEQI